MSDLPTPLTPPDCDLRGYEWMPLLGRRLFASDFDARASDLEFRVAMRLWWEAWQQVPAASLPNDDAVLCRLAGLGRDTKTWKKLRAGMALHGFVLCGDNRWYHHVLAEQALKAYDSRLKHKDDREAATERMRRWRASQNGSHPPEKPNGQAPPIDDAVTRHKGSSDASHSPSRDALVTRHVTSRAFDRTGEDRKEPPRSPPVSRGGRAARSKPHRNGFVELERRLEAAETATIDGTAEDVVQLHDYVAKLKGTAYG